MVVAGWSALFLTGLVAPLSTPIKALSACLAGLRLVSVEGVRDFSARCFPCRAAAAVMGVGFGRNRLPGLGEGSFEDSRRLEERFGGFDGLAKDADETLSPPAKDNVGVSVEGTEDLGEDSAIKQLPCGTKNGD